jgi:ribosomal protein S1
MIETEKLNETEFWEDLEMQDLKRKNKKFKTKEYSEQEKLYDAYFMATPSKNTIVSGEYIGIQSSQHCFDVKGFKDWVRIDNKPAENKYLKNTKVGEKIDLLISSIDDNENFLIHGTICGIYETAAHQSLKALDNDVVIIGRIKSSNPAGYDVEIIHDGITLAGFMPNTLAGINKLYDPDSIVGQQLELMIESFSKEEGTYIVSRRKYLNSLIPSAIKSLDSEVVYTGRVTGTTPFGVFVEFNDCLTGMIHKANVREDWQDRISDIKPGMEIEFFVKEIVKERIILTQILRETLWDNIKNGQILDGVVKDTKQFGVLVSLDEETMGLIHTSEVEKIGKKFESGQEVKVKVLAVDRQNRKIFLTSI